MDTPLFSVSKAPNLLAQATAGTPKVSPYSGSTPVVSPVPNRSVAPPAPSPASSLASKIVPTASLGVRATSPTTTITKPPTTLPASQQAPSSPGSYKGTPITSGTDAEIQAQMAKIDGASTPLTTPQPTNLAGASTGTPPAAGTTAPTPTPAPTYPGLMGALIKNADTTAANGQMTPEELAARQKLAGIPGLIGSTSALIESTPSENAVQTGREAVAGRNIEAQRASLADQVGAYAAERTANTGANTEAGKQYGTATGYAAPQVTTPGQAVFNPVTGTYTNASSGNGTSTTAPSGIDQNSWDQYIKDFASGNTSAIPSAITGNANLSGQLQAAVKEQNPSFDYSTAIGGAGARSSNATLSGTATPNAYNNIYQTALTDYTNLSQSVQNVDQFGNLLTSNMTAGGINPTDVKYANQTLAQIRGQLSSNAQAQYDTTLAALKSKVSGMLAVGGSETPTALTADAQKILDGSLPLSALSGVLQRIQTEGNILLQNQGQKVNTAKAGTMAPTSSQGGNTGAITWDSILRH